MNTASFWVVFLVLWISLWGALHVLSNIFYRFIDLQGVKNWLKQQVPLRFLKPRCQEIIIQTALKPLLAFIVVLIPASSLVDSSNKFCFPETPPFLSLAESGQDWLDFRSRELTFVGRSQELKELDNFLNSKTRFSWWWLNGGAGTGKSRLALEWILLHSSLPIPCLGRGYDTGFFHDVGEEAYWRVWQPRRPTIIVIDDASEHSDRILNLLSNLGQRSKDLAYPVRILLVERTIPENLKQLDEKVSYSEHQYRKAPLKLSPFDSGDLEKLAREVASFRNRRLTWTDNVKKQILKISQGQPLFMIWAIDSFLENNGVIAWDKWEDLVREQATRTREKLLQAGLPELCVPLVAMATLTRHLDWETGQLFISDPACQNKRLFDQLFGQDTTRAIPAIEPDLLGEYFLLEEFRNLNHPRRKLFLDIAWEASPKQVAETLYKIGLDFNNQFRSSGIDRLPANSNQLAWWGRVRVWLLSRENLPTTDIRHYWMELSELAQNHPTDILVNRAAATGAAWGIRNFGNLQLLDDVQSVQKTLESIASRFGEDPGIQAGLSMGLAHAVGPYGRGKRFGEMKIAFEALESTALRFPNEAEIQTMLAMGTVNAITQYVKSPYSNEIPRMFEQIKSLSHRLSVNSSVQLLALFSAAHAIEAFGDIQSWGELENALSFARTIAERFRVNSQFQLGLATAASNAIYNYGKKQPVDKLLLPLDMLKDIGSRFAHDLPIQQIVSKGLVDAIVAYDNAAAEDKVADLFSRLRDISFRFPKDSEIQLYMSNAALDAIKFDAQEQDTARIEGIFKVVSTIGETFPEHIGIQLNLCRLTVNVLTYYVARKQLDKVEKYLDVLRTRTVKFHSNTKFQVVLASALPGAIQAYGQNNQLGPMEQILHSLREMAIKFSGEIMIQRMLAGGLSKSVWFYRVGGESVKMSRLLEELEAKSNQFPIDDEIAGWWALALNQSIYAADKNAEQSYFKLRSLSIRFSENEKVQAAFIGGMGNRMKSLYLNQDKRILQELEPNLVDALEIADRFQTNPDIQLVVAKVTSIAAAVYASRRAIDKMEAVIRTLDGIAARFPDSPEIQSDFAIAGANAVEVLLSARKRDDAEKLLKALKLVAERFPNNREIQKALERAQKSFMRGL